MRNAVSATLVLGLLGGTASVSCVNTAGECEKLGTCTGGGGTGGTGGTGGGGTGGTGGGTTSSATTSTTTAACASQKVKSFGDSGNQAAFTLAAGPSDLVIAGNFFGTLEFGATTLVTPKEQSSGFLARFTGDIGPGVARQMSAQYMAGAVDGNGAFVAVGIQSAAVDLGCTPGTDTMMDYPLGLFVVTYDAAAEECLHTVFGATSITGLSVAADASGNIVIAGGFEGPLALGLGTPLDSDEGGVDIFAAKLNGGAPVWRYSNGGPGDDQASAVAIHSDGTVVVAGEQSGGLDFNLGDDTVGSGGFPTPFLLALKGDLPTPQVSWGRSFQLNDSASAHVAAVAIDTSDASAPAIVLSGDLTGTTAEGVKLVPSVTGEPAIDLQSEKHGLFAARFALEQSGKLLAHNSYPGTGEAASDDMGIGGMAVDAQGRVLLGGWLNQGVELVDGAPLVSPGGTVAFMAVLDSALAHKKSATFGSSGGDNQAFGAAFFEGDAILAGRYSGALDVFGQTATSKGGDDIFIVRLCTE